MASFRIKYFYKVIFLIVFSIMAYLITNMYLVDVPRAVTYSQRPNPVNGVGLGSMETPKYKYSVVVSSSSVRNSSSSSVSMSTSRDLYNGDTNELFIIDESKPRHDGLPMGIENNAPHQSTDWFQGLKVSFRMSTHFGNK